MKIYSSVVLAVAHWWTQAGDLLAALGCAGAVDELHGVSDSRRALHQEHIKDDLQAPTEPPLSTRSEASTVSLPDSVSDDVFGAVTLVFTGDADDQQPHATDSALVADWKYERQTVRCADPEREPELEGDAEPAAKADAPSPADVRGAAIALARRLVPLTTATGRFELEPELSDATTTSVQWKRYLDDKVAFTDVALNYVVACAEASGAGDDTTALVEAYMCLTSSPLYEVEQRALELQREEANADVNAAAFQLVSLVAQAPETEPLLTTVAPVAGQRPLTALEQRLDNVNALVLFRNTPEQVARAPVSVFTGINTDGLCLLELRALLHAASLSKAGATAWRQQLQDTVRVAKKQFDDRRRLHLCDESGSGHACFFHGPTSEQVLPLCAAPTLEDALTRYCDAEATTH